MITTYDPAIDPAQITYRLVFMQWGYRAEHTATVRGHVMGMNSLQAALSQFHDRLSVDDLIPANMVLTDAAGDTLLVDDDEQREEDWLAEMLVAAEIISVEPYNWRDEGGAA